MTEALVEHSEWNSSLSPVSMDFASTAPSGLPARAEDIAQPFTTVGGAPIAQDDPRSPSLPSPSIRSDPRTRGSNAPHAPRSPSNSPLKRTIDTALDSAESERPSKRQRVDDAVACSAMDVDAVQDGSEDTPRYCNGLRSILSPQKDGGAKKTPRKSVRWSPSLVQEKKTKRWLQEVHRSKAAALSEQEMARVAFQQAQEELLRARADALRVAAPWKRPTKLELPTNNQRKYGQGSKHAVEQERLVQDELMETYFNERDIPPNPRQQLRFDESTTQPSRFPLTEAPSHHTAEPSHPPLQSNNAPSSSLNDILQKLLRASSTPTAPAPPPPPPPQPVTAASLAQLISNFSSPVSQQFALSSVSASLPVAPPQSYPPFSSPPSAPSASLSDILARLSASLTQSVPLSPAQPPQQPQQQQSLAHLFNARGPFGAPQLPQNYQSAPFPSQFQSGGFGGQGDRMNVGYNNTPPYPRNDRFESQERRGNMHYRGRQEREGRGGRGQFRGGYGRPY